MNKTSYLLFFCFLILGFLNSCNKDDARGIWTIPGDEVRDGGPGKDGIPAIDNPSFLTIGEVDFLSDEDLLLVSDYGGEIRGYSHIVLDWHEIINDEVNGTAHLAITYCPLTGTGIGWNRQINDSTLTTFGVSGLLYNSNLIPYDRETDSNWSQMQLECVNGELISAKIETYPLLETNWKTFKALFPNGQVNSLSTGHNRTYGISPYGDYNTNDNLLFSVSNLDTRLHPKERVLGVIDSSTARVYRFDDFDGSKPIALADDYKSHKLIIFGSQEQNFLMAFSRVLEDGVELNFLTESVSTSSSVLFADTEGNQWNLFGEAVAGPRAGQRLIGVPSYLGYWFSWGAFYPDAEIF